MDWTCKTNTNNFGKNFFFLKIFRIVLVGIKTGKEHVPLSLTGSNQESNQIIVPLNRTKSNQEENNQIFSLCGGILKDLDLSTFCRGDFFSGNFCPEETLSTDDHCHPSKLTYLSISTSKAGYILVQLSKMARTSFHSSYKGRKLRKSTRKSWWKCSTIY